MEITQSLASLSHASLKSKLVQKSAVNGPSQENPLATKKGILTVTIFAGEELERFVEQDDWQRDFQDSDPFIQGEWADLEDGREDLDVQDHEVQSHGQADGGNKPNVGPRRHHQHRLVLRQAVEGVQHFNGDQDGESHGHRVGIVEDGAIDTL